MTSAELELCFIDLEEREAERDHYDRLAEVQDEDELPSCCERNGCEFGGAAVKVGDRWVCTDCEEDEYEDFYFDLEQALNELQEREFSAQRDEF